MLTCHPQETGFFQVLGIPIASCPGGGSRRCRPRCEQLGLPRYSAQEKRPGECVRPGNEIPTGSRCPWHQGQLRSSRKGTGANAKRGPCWQSSKAVLVC